MKNLHIRFLAIIGALCIAGILCTQVFWVSKAMRDQQRAFSHKVQMAMLAVVNQLCELNGNDSAADPVEQISSGYFIAKMRYYISIEDIRGLIVEEFHKRQIEEDFEYGIYDCQRQAMLYGDYVSFGMDKDKRGKLPKLDHDEYYFGVYFPNRNSIYTNQLGFWKFTSLLTVLITAFFGYALFVVFRQKRLGEIQKDFINNMTHEFKTPLSTIMLSAQVLKKECNSDKGSKYADIVTYESEKLQQNISQILLSEKIAFKSNETTELFETQPVIDRIVKRFSSSDKEFKFDCTAENVKIKGSPIVFEQIIFNLIDNAIKYGHTFVGITCKTANKKLMISISNDGTIISPKEQKRIFRKFYRIPQGDRHDVKGFGLGLHYVRHALKSLNGTISVQSENELTAFQLQIPIK